MNEDVRPLFPLIFGNKKLDEESFPQTRTVLQGKYVAHASEYTIGFLLEGEEEPDWDRIKQQLLRPRLARLPSGKVVRLIPYDVSLQLGFGMHRRPIGARNRFGLSLQGLYEHEGDITPSLPEDEFVKQNRQVVPPILWGTYDDDFANRQKDLLLMSDQLEAKIESLLMSNPDSTELVSLVNAFRRAYGREPRVHSSVVDRLARIPQAD
jgi:hypothetical protein